MHKGFASLIGLLIAALIAVIMFLLIGKTVTKNTPSPKESETIQNDAQDAVDKYQQKSIQNQNPDLQ